MMKKFVSLIVIIAVVLLGIVFVPKLLHTCDDCDRIFVGTGYVPNIVTDALSEKEQIICRECAEKQHAVAIALGKSVDDYKRDLFD